MIARDGDGGHRRRVWLLLAVLSVVAAATALGACGGSGSTAPSADVQFLSPRDFNAADFAGKPLVVNYFGSWCGPCNLEAPALSAFAKAQSGNAAFVGVAFGDEQSDVVDFMSKYGLTYPVVMDDNSVGAEAGVSGYPTTIFYNASGQEVDRLVGAASLEQFNLSLSKAQ